MGAQREPVQPVFTRYWLHNSGTAPLGYLPVAVHVSPTRRVVSAGFEVSPRVTVASSLVGATRSGVIQVLAPEGWQVSAAALPYELEPMGWCAYDLTVTAPAEVASGHHPVRVRIEDGGQLLEDVAMLLVGSDADHGPDLDGVEGGDHGLGLRLDGLTGIDVRAGGHERCTER